jgi:hypothetical protein
LFLWASDLEWFYFIFQVRLILAQHIGKWKVILFLHSSCMWMNSSLCFYHFPEININDQRSRWNLE